MNVCSLSGRLTWQPELRYQANGKPELYLRVSVPNGEQEGQQFFLPYDVLVYGKDCEPLAEQLEAGDLVELTGQNAWPKAPRKPGGKWIPAAICFGVTRLSGSAATDAYGSGADDEQIPLEPVSGSAPTSAKPVRRRGYPKAALQGGFQPN